MTRNSAGKSPRVSFTARPRRYSGDAPDLIEPRASVSQANSESLSRQRLRLKLEGKVAALSRYAETAGVEILDENLDHLATDKIVPFNGDTPQDLMEALAKEDLCAE